jgi:hypothetical protein
MRAKSRAVPQGTFPHSRPGDLYQLIGPTFERLAQRPDRDTSRPGIEFYRRHDVIDLLLPID